MASRQKSFFDQNHGNKPNSRPREWPRSRPGDFPKRTNLDKRESIMSGPPITPSTQAKSKLKAFQFLEGRPKHDPEKENQGTADAATKAKDSNDQLPAKPALVQSKTDPTTPGPNRPPLVDLLGSEDLPSASKRVSLSPDEQIYWHIPASSQLATTPARKKRARSSSPASATRNNSRNVKKRRQGTPSTRTPKADPAADLWNRYAVNTSNAESAPNTSAFAHLMAEASPRSSATAGSVGGLRRWASCGAEWPASKTKKRRTAGAFREPLAPIDDEESDEASELPQAKVSKVGALVEKIQKSLAEQPTHNSDAGPSSSSPLPGAVGFGEDAPGSPLQRLAPIQESAGTSQSNTIDAETDAGPKDDADPSDSSEFGDDIDEELLEAAVESTGLTVPGLDGNSEQPSRKVPVDSGQQEQHPRGSAEGEKKGQIFADSDDEFGLGDGDDFEDDLETAMTQYDLKTSNPAQTVSTAPQNDSKKNFVVDDDSDDEFGDDDIDEEQFAAAEVAATQGYKPSAFSSENKVSRTIQRYLVVNVVEGQFKTAKGYMLPEKVLVVEEEKTKKMKAITLRQSWYDTRCTPGSYVHVIGQFSSTGECTVDDDNNMLILHPDHLISATTVGDSFSCMRKAVLQDRVKATSDASEPAMIGTMLHEIFQEAMKANRWDREWLAWLIKKIIPRKFEMILEIGLTVEHVIDRLMGKLPQLQGWARIFVKTKPGQDAVVKDRESKTLRMSIDKLLEVEEHIWSPMYGLKGNIDASIQAVMQDEHGERVVTAPFELKTGRATNISHQAQTALYTLLMSDRYDVDIAYGVLYYLDSSEISRIPAIRHEIRQMIIQRNELACYVRERLQLPPMLKNSHACNRCYAQETCFIYHRLAEYGEAETLSGPAKQKFEELVRNLKVPHQEFFKKWDLLLTQEESDVKKFHRELWTMLSHEREKLGRCFANVVVESDSFIDKDDGEKINRFQYTLAKHEAPTGFSFTESQITVGEPIVISDEKGHFALANGYVKLVRRRSITVSVDRRLHNARIREPDFHPRDRQKFAGIMGVTSGPAKSTEYVQADGKPILYRLDKDEFSNGMAMVRNNLIQLMNDGDFRAMKLRSLIVDGATPEFKPSPSAYSIRTQSQGAMNSDQEAAVEKVFSAQDYALVLGMPGTGKTTTIAHIIRSLVAKGKSVLLTSYTHTAVDNILLKIRNDGIGILRLGATAKIHPEVQEFATIAAHPVKTLEELERSWKDPPVVATTCLTINHPIFRRRLFDYCIVDEASQITLPVCLGPIRMAKRFILVGDHYQLPPLVQNKDAQEGGLDVSLFKLLSDKQPESVVNLEHQYRMCADVMLLSNTLIYNGRLKCGNQAVADRSLNVPSILALQRFHESSRSSMFSCTSSSSKSLCPSPNTSSCWLQHTVLPANKVVFLNTDPLLPSSLEAVANSRMTSPVEATLTLHAVEAFLAAGIDAADIGVITFYRSQLALLRQSLRHRPGLELHTADKFQGRDKEVILVSCVRSNEACIVGELLKDWRRVNVAVTRARSKLVILGSKRTLVGSGNETLKGLVDVCESKGWVLDLPANAARDHSIDDSGLSQTQADTDAGCPGVERKMRDCKLRSPKRSPMKQYLAPKGANAGAASQSPTKKSKKPLSSQSNQGVKRTTRVPEKRGVVSKKALLSGRAVLRDIVNDAMGDAGWE